MKKQKTLLKKIICGATTLSMATLAVTGLFCISPKNIDVKAATDNMAKVEISNSNFTSKSTKNQPSNFTAFNKTGNVTDFDNLNIEAKVIDIESTTYKSKYKNLERGSNFDKNVLMISNDDTNHKTYFGYKTSENITMAADSNYMVTVDVYTDTKAEIVDLFLYDDTKVFSSLENISSLNNWTTYSFFVTTNESKASNLKLGMVMDGAGSAMFDNIAAYKINDAQLSSNLSALALSTYAYEDKSEASVIADYTFRNGQAKLYNAATSTYENISKFNYNADKDNSEYVTDAHADNNVLSMENKKATYSQYITDGIFKFNQMELYKVTISLNATLESGNAYLRLVDSSKNLIDCKANSKSDDTITISSSSSKDMYDKYSFYISGHSLKDTEYKLVFGLGDSENTAVGKINIKDISFAKINYENFKSASTTNAKTINLSTHPSSAFIVTNGDFNEVEISDYNKPFPAKPTAWTVSTLNETQIVGVGNTSEEGFNNLKTYSGLSLINPETNPKNNNVLLMHHQYADTSSIISATKTLEAESLHKFTLSAKTYGNAKLNVSLISTINDKEIVLASKTINSSSSFWGNNNGDKQAELFIKNGHQSIDVAVKITLITEGNGYAYIDDVMMDYLIAPTADEFAQAQTNNKTTVDLTDLLTSSSDEQWSNSPLFSLQDNSNVKAGIIKADGSPVFEDEDAYQNLKNINNKNILAISSDSDTFYTATSKIGYALSADGYYKLTLKVFAHDLSSNEESSNYGASVKLTNFDNQFKGINTNDTWQEISFYIHPTSTTTSNIELSLGDAENSCKGMVFFGDIDFSKIEEAEYLEATDSAFVKVLKQTTEEEKEDETTETESENEKGNFWLFLTGIATGAAVLIAIIAILLRKIKWKKRPKKTKAEYDRKQTVSKQVLTRKATVMREEKLLNLTKDLEKAKAERSQHEDNYKANMSKLRELKLKRATKSEISALEKEIKQNQKLASSFGLTVNNIESELDYVKTDAYLNSLMKKLAKGAIIEDKPEDNNSENQ